MLGENDSIPDETSDEAENFANPECVDHVRQRIEKRGGFVQAVR
jgi:hypothetical protein